MESNRKITGNTPNSCKLNTLLNDPWVQLSREIKKEKYKYVELNENKNGICGTQLKQWENS